MLVCFQNVFRTLIGAFVSLACQKVLVTANVGSFWKKISTGKVRKEAATGMFATSKNDRNDFFFQFFLIHMCSSTVLLHYIELCKVIFD